MVQNLSGTKKYIRELSALIFCTAAFMWVLYAFTGQWPWSPNPYNSYTLQACAWLKGRLSLEHNYEYLELAVCQGKYFVSFPPFPSYIMLPFALLFGENTPDGWIAVGVWVLGSVYAYRLFRESGRNQEKAFFWTLFLLIGTNLVFIKVNGWVWFIAQSMCFTLSIMALYYGRKGRAGLSLALWACSVGTRPLQVLWLPVLLFVIWREIKPEESGLSFAGQLGRVLKKRFPCLIPAAVIALSFMLLNYARFGNIAEFGHNYLPEFLEAENGQFHLSYMLENAGKLFRLPRMTAEGRLDFYGFDGFAFWLASPLYLSWFYYLLRGSRKKFEGQGALTGLIAVTAAVHTAALLSHKTMGGWHFGNRYMNDLLPYIFYSLILLIPKDDRSEGFQRGLFLLGCTLNAVGTAALYNYWI